VVKDIWGGTATHARVFTRKLRVFGHGAPAKLAVVALDPTNADPTKHVQWTSVSLSAGDWQVQGTDLPLDAVYDELVVGDSLLVYEAFQGAQVVTVTALSQGEEILGANSLVSGSLADHRHRATVTRATVSPAVAITDRRRVNIYRLKGLDIPLWSGDFPPLIQAGRLYLPAARLDPAGEALEIGRTVSGRDLAPGVAIRLSDIDEGRAVMLQDHTGRPLSASVRGRALGTFENQDFLVLEVEVETAENLSLETRSAVLLGNVARASHGETVADEILGDGDAAAPFQSFALRKKPLTHLSSARRVRGESSLEIRVGGVRWNPVDSLYAQPPEAPVYVARQADDDNTSVRFGDGADGARLPSGTGNVVARYRFGAGLAGRLRPGQLNVLLDRPVGLKAVTNPAATEGGADAETLAQAREAAPATVRTFDRAVSLLDFQWLATASGEVARAKATRVWQGAVMAVHLTVAGQQGGLFSAEALTRLHDGLTAQRDPNHPLLLANVCRVPVVLEAALHLDERQIRDTVVKAARRALLGFFAFEAMDFARPVHLSQIYSVLQDVTGVAAVTLKTLHFKGYDTWTAAQLASRGAIAAPLQPHLRLFAARPSAGSAALDPTVAACFGAGPVPAVLPAEQAFIQVPDQDLILTPTGGLS
jgi:hypothetical protein